MRKMFSINQIKDIVNEGIEDGSIHADPSTEVKVADINSESATAGKVIMADGEGGAEWDNIDMDIPSITIVLNTTTTESLRALDKRMAYVTNSDGSTDIAYIKVTIVPPSSIFIDVYSLYLEKLHHYSASDDVVTTLVYVSNASLSVTPSVNSDSSWQVAQTFYGLVSMDLNKFQTIFYVDATSRSDGDVIPSDIRKYYMSSYAIQVNNKVYTRSGYEFGFGTATAYKVYISITHNGTNLLVSKMTWNNYDNKVAFFEYTI